MSNAAEIPIFGDTATHEMGFIPSLTPEVAAQIAAGIPVQGATVAEPGNTPILVDGIWVDPGDSPQPVDTPVDNAPETEPAVAVQFDTLDREKLEYLYEVAVKVGALIEQITPQQLEQVKTMQENPVLKRLLGSILPKM